MFASADLGHRRVGLDALMAQAMNPGFTMKYRRVPAMRERGGHVSPSMLAMQRQRSRYVRTWQRHARQCSECASVFRYFGFSIR